MSGIIGRLFREFAVTIAMTIFVSALVSLTLTPMMASRFLKSRRRGAARPALQARRADVPRRWRTATRAGSTSCSRISSRRLLVFLATVAATVHLFLGHPQGVLPATGHRHVLRRLGSRPGRFVPRDGAAARTTRRDRAGRPRRRHHGDGARRRRRQRGAEQRASCSAP